MIIKTLTVYDVATELLDDSSAHWSENGALSLAFYLDSLSEDMAENMVLDCIALRCEYDEYICVMDYNDAYGTDFYEWSEVEQVVATVGSCGAIVYAH